MKTDVWRGKKTNAIGRMLNKVSKPITYNGQGLLSVIEFEKQMYMIPTKDDLIYEVCTALGRSEDDAVLSLVDKLLLMFEPQQLLQQTPCTTLLELLQQMLNEEQIAYMQSKNSMEADMRLYNEDALKAVIKLINARQPIA